MKISNGTYVSVSVKNREELYDWFKVQGVNVVPEDELHSTIAYSRKEFIYKPTNKEIVITPKQFKEITTLGDDGAIVLKFNSKEMQKKFDICIESGATTDYPKYQPHITITYNGKDLDISKLKLPTFDIILYQDKSEELDLEYKEKLKEKEMPNNIIKSFATKSGKTEKEVEKMWDDLKKEYGDNYEAITGTLKKILKINEGNEMNVLESLDKKVLESLLEYAKAEGIEDITEEMVQEFSVKYKEIVKDSYNKKIEEDESYKEYFDSMLKKFNVESPKDLSEEDKKKFYDAVDKGWKAKDEKPEVNESVDSILKTIKSKESVLKTKELTGDFKGKKVKYLHVYVKDSKSSNPYNLETFSDSEGSGYLIPMNEDINESLDLTFLKLAQGNTSGFINDIKELALSSLKDNEKFKDISGTLSNLDK